MLQVFEKTDAEMIGSIDWNSRKISSFIKGAFQRLKLQEPEEQQMYWMYTKFDKNGDWRLDKEECLDLIQMLCFTLLNIEDHENPESMSKAVQCGEVAAQVEQIFATHDRNSTGVLEWNNGEVRDFIGSICSQLSIPLPAEHQLFAMFKKFDSNCDGSLDVSWLFPVDWPFSDSLVIWSGYRVIAG